MVRGRLSQELEPLTSLGGTCQFMHWVWSVIIVFVGLENGSIGPVRKFLKKIITFASFLDYSMISVKSFKRKKSDK